MEKYLGFILNPSGFVSIPSRITVTSLEKGPAPLNSLAATQRGLGWKAGRQPANHNAHKINTPGGLKARSTFHELFVRFLKLLEGRLHMADFELNTQQVS